MSDRKRFLWLDGVFDQHTINVFPSISPASNFWQRGFIDALQSLGNHVDIIGHTHERIWPFGRLIIFGKQASLPKRLKGLILGYINAPFLRGVTRYFNYLRAVKIFFSTSEKPNYIVTFSCLSKSSDPTASIYAAKFIRKHYGVPWICIVADGEAPPGADGYVYLTWSYYKSVTAYAPKIHIDGGVPAVQSRSDQSFDMTAPRKVKILMYMGALTPHGGASQLARAFHLLADKDVILRICGRGENTELRELAKVDRRIELLGFVSEEELNKLASEATAFVNPRPTDFEPNKLNYPSKVLHYLAYGKPVISTFTEGISPDYMDILIPISEATDEGLCIAIQKVLNMTGEDYDVMRDRIVNFNKAHSWEYQVDRFITWLQNEI